MSSKLVGVIADALLVTGAFGSLIGWAKSEKQNKKLREDNKETSRALGMGVALMKIQEREISKLKSEIEELKNQNK